MVFPMVLLKLAEWVLYQLLANSCYRAATKMRSYGFFLKNPSFKSSQLSQQNCFPSVTKCSLEGRGSADKILVCDIPGVLLRNKSFFPYFMLVAFEGGCILRAFLLLLSCSFLWVLNNELQLKVMIFITFCGLRVKDMKSVSRAVLPKFYLENLNLQAYELLASAGSKVVVTNVPKIMVEGFLKEYLSVNKVIGTELHTLGHLFTGLVSGSGLLSKHTAVKEHFGDKKPDIGLGCSSQHDLLFLSLCKEGYVINKEDGKINSAMPRHKYPKPLVFHDGRLAFLPTPLATLAMFMWLPIGIILSIFRLFVGIFLPYNLANFLATLSGVRICVKGCKLNPSKTSKKGVLYVCTHRTLLDPVFLSTSLGKPLTAVTYSLSKMSEIIAPIRTVRLTRDRKKDGETMERLLGEGDLVVCPEGTTCREPYLLRFSSLFAELAEEIVPVAMNTQVSMFYGTTASGFKCLDPIFFLMNPRPSYHVQILGKVPRRLTCAGGKSSCEVANYIQKQLGLTLGFECTNLTRKDKYLMLAGHEGIVQQTS
ncbi:glycerol-3-phosphate acyltransferase 1 [Tripterygium wilfordii]|uniref:Glycerol-3-phosphate acyltransferase 1 n=1 Tax=Tripterygium wilfordii TaxID=458696 RepID=A0A7J7CF26_TRIWF|nr:glycerol-3-phosphate acyltransferase 1 [Tripterygium wilfordii]KAF5732487.1 glycerol-3-phosphate acyltransferase 1 [Tripterygium wilfordii]